MSFDVVVVGGGAAGVDAAVAARRHAPDASLALISPQPDLFYRPWLVYLPAAAVPTEDLSIPLSGIAERHGFERIEDGVGAIDPETRELVLTSTGKRVDYGQLILAPGAPADRQRIPGSDEHALFPCDPSEARQLLGELNGLNEGTIVFLLTGERIGPGLEYAGWVAKAMRAAGRRAVRVLAVEDGDAMDRQFGAKAAARLVTVASTAGVETVRHANVERIGDGELVLSETTINADIIAVTSPLRGPDVGLPAELLDERGLVKVDGTLATPAFRNVFAAGDFSCLQGVGLDLPKTWIMARLQAETAGRNAAAALTGGDATRLDLRKVARMASISMPDVGGRTLLVKNRKPIVAGSWPLRLRYRMDGKYLSQYRDRPGVRRPTA
ncbi:FAD-dependent oxidoreductase [Streptomyces lavendulocolor]|uniref:FAD-dependent oxidoreductase n=1 Tax=Streptomyces lavendulocolor TaxID=67316 RepID=A0ABV2W232_9ACTN|nr:sulfide-quinone reductase [Streptomyces cellulosae]